MTGDPTGMEGLDYAALAVFAKEAFGSAKKLRKSAVKSL